MRNGEWERERFRVWVSVKEPERIEGGCKNKYVRGSEQTESANDGTREKQIRKRGKDLICVREVVDTERKGILKRNRKMKKCERYKRDKEEKERERSKDSA